MALLEMERPGVGRSSNKLTEPQRILARLEKKYRGRGGIEKPIKPEKIKRAKKRSKPNHMHELNELRRRREIALNRCLG